MGKAVIIDKIPTTPSDPELAVMEVVKKFKQRRAI